jgi:hypothetical protein
VSGLSGTGLVLQNNGGDSLSVSASGSFTFVTPVSSGGIYSVMVLTQPSSPAQTCSVTNGNGTASANVTGVQIACVTSHNVWTWVNGSNVVNQIGIYGTRGTTNPANIPGARFGAISWIDKEGTFWLFGGFGYDSVGTQGDLNDMWKFSAGAWTWMGGPNVANQAGTYGDQGTATASNIPGARCFSAGWTDTAGNFWLFGGSDYALSGPYPYFNDLWEYSPSTSEWTWMGGSNTTDQSGIYGTQGTPSPSNIPGARPQAVNWRDESGNFWLFGGAGYGLSPSYGLLNDLWEYSAGEWTWAGGADISDAPGTYGTPEVPAPNNDPGARSGAVGWTDPSGNFWLFGGYGYGPNPSYGLLNDLWEYSAGEWAWMGGANAANAPGVYGSIGDGNCECQPGGRSSAATWIDASGTLWLFGGNAISPDDSGWTQGYLNDLWKYNGNGWWTWVGGSNTVNQVGNYGSRGAAATTNFPGARWGMVSWIDSSGNLWLFGGNGMNGNFNDLWEYQP